MTKDEVIKYFNNKFNSCYYVTHEDYPESIFMYYDPQIVRKIKLAKISGKPITVNKVKGICLFEQDWKNKYLNCDHSEIWLFLYNNYSPNYVDIQSFISDMLSDADKLNALLPLLTEMDKLKMLSESDKMSVLTPSTGNTLNYFLSLNADKLSVLTPENDYQMKYFFSLETDKLNTLKF